MRLFWYDFVDLGGAIVARLCKVGVKLDRSKSVVSMLLAANGLLSSVVVEVSLSKAESS